MNEMEWNLKITKKRKLHLILIISILLLCHNSRVLFNMTTMGINICLQFHFSQISSTGNNFMK